jgi:carbonic anhydrase
VQDVRAKHDECLGLFSDDTARTAKLCELNVIEQVANVCSTTIVQDAWTRGQPLNVHGWIYGLRDGLLRDLHTTASDNGEAAAAYEQAVEAASTGGTSVPW